MNITDWFLILTGILTTIIPVAWWLIDRKMKKKKENNK